MAGWLHGVFVGDWLFVFPLCGFSLSLFCNYNGRGGISIRCPDCSIPNVSSCEGLRMSAINTRVRIRAGTRRRLQRFCRADARCPQANLDAA